MRAIKNVKSCKSSCTIKLFRLSTRRKKARTRKLKTLRLHLTVVTESDLEVGPTVRDIGAATVIDFEVARDGSESY